MIYASFLILGTIWLIISVLAQFRSRLSRYIRQVDVWGFVPNWQYFVGNFMEDEYLIEFVHDDGSRSAALPPPIHIGMWSALLNPQRLELKSFQDITFLSFNTNDPKYRAALRKTVESMIEHSDDPVCEWKTITFGIDR